VHKAIRFDFRNSYVHCPFKLTVIVVFIVLSREENAMGQFLKEQGSLDKTAAGKMMTAVGKAQCYTSQQRFVNYLRQHLLLNR